MKKLHLKAWLGLVVLGMVMGVLLFIPAGTVRYWQAWVFLVVFLGMSLLITIYLMKKNPALLERRLCGGPTAEKEITQKVIMFFTSIGFITVLAVSGLDHRFGWSAMPVYLVIIGDILIVTGFYIVFLVYKENPFSSATIEVVQGQKVISTGRMRGYAIQCMEAGCST